VIEHSSLDQIALLSTAVATFAPLSVNFNDTTDIETRLRDTFATPLGTSGNDAFRRWFGLLCDKDLNIRDLIGFRMLVDELQRMFDDDPAQKRRLSPLATEIFSELGTTCQIAVKLRGLYPFGVNLYELIKISLAADGLSTADAELVDSAFRKGGGLAHAVFPISENLHYPQGKARTKENVEALRCAESNLERFRVAAGANLRKIGAVTSEEMLVCYSGRPRRLHLTPEYAADAPNLNPDEDEVLHSDVVNMAAT
jgi:hypothetical protein